MKIEKYNESEEDDAYIKLILHDSANNLYEVKYYSPFNGHGPFESIIDNEIYTFDFTYIYPKIIKKEPLNINIIGLSGIKIKNKIYPISLDLNTPLKSKKDFESDIIDLLWLILSGEAGNTIYEVIKFIDERVSFENSKQTFNSDNILRNYINQYYSYNEPVKYHPEMKLAAIDFFTSNNEYLLQIGTNDKNNLVYKYKIFKSSDKSTIIVSPINFNDRPLQIKENILFTNNNILNALDFLNLFKDRNLEIKII